MKLLYIVVALCLFGYALATSESKSLEEEAPSESGEDELNNRDGRAMGGDDDDDFSADFDEIIRYFQRGVKRFMNRMSSVQERQGFGSTIPFIGRLIFQSLSYLGSFLVGALAVPPLLAGNALSLFGLYSPDQPNPLLNGQVLPNFSGAASNTNRNGVAGLAGAAATSNQQVNDLSEALFRLGQKNSIQQHQQQQVEFSNAGNTPEQMIAQAAGSNNPVEISEIVNDLIRVQSSIRPTTLWNRLTSGLSVFLPQVSRQVGPVGALGSLLLLGTALGAPYFLNRRADDGGLFSSNDEFSSPSYDSSEDPSTKFMPPADNNKGYNNKPARQRKHEQQQQYSAETTYEQPAGNDIGYAQQQQQQPSPAYSPYNFVQRRQGEPAGQKVHGSSIAVAA